MTKRNDVEGLIKALGFEKNPNIRSEAAWALRNIGDSRAVQPLLKSLSDSSWFVRANSAIALGMIGDTQAVEPLIKALYDNYTKVCGNAAWALENIGWKPSKDENSARYWIVKEEWEKCAEIGKPAVEPLINVLNYSDKDTRWRAIKILGKIKDARAVGPLIKTLNDSKEDVRWSAAEALGKLGDSRAIEPLIKTLNDSNDRVCKNAAEALEIIGWKPGKDENSARYWIVKEEWEKCAEIGKPAVEPLIQALSNNDLKVREKVAEALGRTGDSHAVQAVIKVISYDALAKIGTPAIGPLIRALNDPDTLIRSRAAQALGEIGNARAVEPLIKALNYSDYYSDWSYTVLIIEALGKIGDARAFEHLIKALSNSNYEVRKSVAEALGKLGDSRAIEPLIKTLNDSNDRVCKNAAEALEIIGWKPGKDEVSVQYWIVKEEWEKCAEIGKPAVEPLIQALSNNDLKVRERAAEALGKIGDARAVEPLIKALNNFDHRYMSSDSIEAVREKATQALGNIGLPAFEPLIQALSDSNDRVRKRAAEALEISGWKPSEDENAVRYWIANKNWGKCIEIGAPAVEPLIQALNYPNWNVLQETAKALGKIGDARAVEPLIKALYDSYRSTDSDKYIYIIALLEALGNIGDPRAAEPLIEGLSNFHWDIRKEAATNLIKLYENNKVDEVTKKYILFYRALITTPHDDRDFSHSSDCSHVDRGIEINFPV